MQRARGAVQGRCVSYSIPSVSTEWPRIIYTPDLKSGDEDVRQQAQELLRLGVRPDRDAFVVTQADGNPLQPRSLTHEWVRVIGTTKLPRVRFHDLRHAHATHMRALGVHPKVAIERLGHSKVGITLDLYSHVMPGMQDDAVAKVDAALKAA